MNIIDSDKISKESPVMTFPMVNLLRICPVLGKINIQTNEIGMMNRAMGRVTWLIKINDAGVVSLNPIIAFR